MAATEWELRRAAVGQDRMSIVLCDDDDVFMRSLRCELERVFEKLHVGAHLTCCRKLADIPRDILSGCAMAFLDMDFEDEEYTGLDIACMLRRVNDHALIFFVTNFIEYAPAGYEVQAFRYILKRDMGEVLERYVMQAVEAVAQGQELLRLQDREEPIDLLLDEIEYMEVLDHSVSIHAGGKVYPVNTTLSGFEKKLETRGFLRVHKSYLVNMRYIRKFRSRECLLANGVMLAVSEKNYSQQKQKYLLWKGLA